MYTLPDFNLLADIWYPPNYPYLGGADISGLPCQLYWNSRVPASMDRPIPSGFLPTIILRYPTAWYGYLLNGTIIGFATNTLPSKWFVINSQMTAHKGFPNEYLAAILEPCDDHGGYVA